MELLKLPIKYKTSALNKITQNLPKNAMYNKTNGIISIENKNFIQVGTDTLTNSPILREIGYNKGSYALKGNHYVSTSDGLYMIGKNALQNTGTKVVTNSNLAEFMRLGLNPVRNTYHNVLNGYLKNSYQINKDVIDFTESILPGIPSYSDIGYGAAVGAGLYGFYKDWKNDK